MFLFSLMIRLSLVPCIYFFYGLFVLEIRVVLLFLSFVCFFLFYAFAFLYIYFFLLPCLTIAKFDMKSNRTSVTPKLFKCAKMSGLHDQRQNHLIITRVLLSCGAAVALLGQK